MEGSVHVTLIGEREIGALLEHLRERRHLRDIATDWGEVYRDEITVGGPRCGLL